MHVVPSPFPQVLASYPQKNPVFALDVDSFLCATPISCGLGRIDANFTHGRRVGQNCLNLQVFLATTWPKRHKCAQKFINELIIRSVPKRLRRELVDLRHWRSSAPVSQLARGLRGSSQ